MITKILLSNQYDIIISKLHIIPQKILPLMQEKASNKYRFSSKKLRFYD
jgi:hypothetical protein